MLQKEKNTKDCYYCQFIDNCKNRKTAKKSIDIAANTEKAKVKLFSLMPSYSDQYCLNLYSKVIHRSNKARNFFLKHLHHDYDVKAGVYLWNHPQKMKYLKPSALGERKRMSSSDRKKKKKKQRRGINKYHKYSFSYKNRLFTVKTEYSIHGYEQLYALYESRD